MIYQTNKKGKMIAKNSIKGGVKPGQKVRIQRKAPRLKSYAEKGIGWTKEMDYFLGEVVTITEIDFDKMTFKHAEDDGQHVWHIGWGNVEN